MSPSLSLRHQDIVLNLVRRLADFVDAYRCGKVAVAPLDVHLPSGDVVEPDILFVATGNLSLLQDWVRGVPDLIIEVLSPSGVERDRFVKRDLYSRNGILEYWIVDDADDSVEVFALTGGHYEPAGYFRGSEFIHSAILEGLAIRAADVFP